MYALVTFASEVPAQYLAISTVLILPHDQSIHGASNMQPALSILGVPYAKSSLSDSPCSSKAHRALFVSPLEQVHVAPLGTGLTTQETVDIYCGQGEQILQWLGHTACARLAYKRGEVTITDMDCKCAETCA